MIHSANHRKCALSKLYIAKKSNNANYLHNEISIILDMIKRQICFYFVDNDDNKVLKKQHDFLDMDTEYRSFVHR